MHPRDPAETWHALCELIDMPPEGGVLHRPTSLREFHTMRKLLPLLIALGAASGAQANTILIDSFNFPFVGGDQFVKANNVVNGTQTSVTVDPSMAADFSYATARTLAVTCLDDSGATGTNSLPCISAAAASGQGAGRLEVNTRNNFKATSTITWILPANNALVFPASYFFQIISNNTGSPGSVPTNVDFKFNGLSDGNVSNDFDLVNQNFGSVAGVPATFALGASDVNKLKGGGTLQMILSSTGTGWSISLDQFALSTPEPSALALVGLALLGAGVASRRRKTA